MSAVSKEKIFDMVHRLIWDRDDEAARGNI